MNKLNEDVLDTIYRFKHNLEFKEVMNELTQVRIYTKYNFSLMFCLLATFRGNDGQTYKCVNINNIECNGKELLKIIKNKNKYHELLYII
jgi:hypothetical protein